MIVNRISYLNKIRKNYGGLRGAFNFIRLTLESKARKNDQALAADILRQQNALFDEIGCSIEDAAAFANAEAARLGIPDGAVMTTRIHILGFAALAKAGFKPAHILELGTNTGQTSRFLAEIFPDAVVHTFELPADDPLFPIVKPFGEEGHQARSARNLDHPRIRAYRFNTMRLLDLDLPKFDLIWLDAGHEYPEVAWDHFYCVSRLAPGGWLFSDDIVKPDNRLVGHDPKLLEAGKVVEYIDRRMGGLFRYIPKRRELDQHIIFNKFIAVLRKPAP